MESSKLRKSSKYIEQNTTSKSTAVTKVNEDKFNQWWFGAYVHHEHNSEKNIKNFILFIIAIMPTIFYSIYINTTSSISKLQDPKQLTITHNWLDLLEIYEKHGFTILMFWSPLALINFLFFINIDIGFYLIGLVQKSFWLIDPYWSIIPFIYGLVYATHPLAIINARSLVALVLVFIWGARLTHSYFRREDWKFGEREDWRYTKMAKDFGHPWWYFVSFFTVGVAQHPMIIGISLPLYSVTFSPDASTQWSWLDTTGMYLTNLSSFRSFL